MIKLIVGLGNPGPQYEKTRHNAGFMFLDYLASSAAAGWVVDGRFQGEVATCSLMGNKLYLLKPMTYMNRSGISVGAAIRYYKIKPEEVLVVHDELELSEGDFKLKRDGGHAGHNGLRDIIAHLNSRDFFRLRIGVGRPVIGANVADYVLSRPSRESVEVLENVCRVAMDKMDLLISGDMAAINGLSSVKR